MEKKKIQLIAVIAIFAVIGVVAVIQLMNLPGSGGAAKKAVEETPRNYEDRLLKAEMLVKRLLQHRRAVEEKKELLDQYLYEVPLSSDPAWLTRQINLIADEVGIGEVSQKFRPELASGAKLPEGLAGKYGQRTWELRTKTGYHSIGEFLNRLEETNSFLEVVDINIDGDPPRGHNVSLLIRYLTQKGEGRE